MADIVYSHESEAALVAAAPPSAVYQNVTLLVSSHTGTTPNAESGEYKCIDTGGSVFQWVKMESASGVKEVNRGNFAAMLADTVSEMFVVDVSEPDEANQGGWARLSDDDTWIKM